MLVSAVRSIQDRDCAATAASDRTEPAQETDMNNRTAIVTAVAAALFAASPVSAAPPAQVTPAPAVRGVAVAAPTAVEVADLVFMREEEKVARDVYLGLYERYDLAIFSAIAAAEQSHMDAVLTQLVKHGIPDPAAGHAIGEFADTELQLLYVQALAASSADVAGAVKTGGLIEETDLADLDVATSNSSSVTIRNVYANLACGSRNHLRSFAATFASLTGTGYVAQRLPQSRVDEMLAAPMERCGRR
jgi:hypothetical protein